MGSMHYFKDLGGDRYQVKKCVGQSHASRKHVHAEWAVALVTGGESRFHFIDETYAVKKGQLIIIGPGFAHQCIPEDVKAWAYYLVLIADSWLEYAGIAASRRSCLAVKDLNPEAYQNLLRCFETLCHPGDEDEEEALYFIADTAFSEDKKIVINLEAEQMEAAIALVCDHIRGHLDETPKLEELADMAGINKFQMIRYFNRMLNTTPHAWQNMLRMNQARLLLEEGVAPAEAGIAVGFYDQSHFSRNFKECFGVTPGQFTAMNGKK